MTVVYIASDEAGAGKTAVSTSLASLFNQRGVKTAVVQPLGEPTPDPKPQTPNPEAGGLGSRPLPLEGLTDGLMGQVVSEVKALAGKHQVVLVESSNALSFGDGRRLAEALDAKVLAVVRHRHGMDATTLGSWSAMHGDRLLGFLFNQRGLYLDTEVKTSLLPSLASAKLKSFGIIPEDRALLAVTVGQIAGHLGGRFVTDENNLDGLVEYFLVGGWMMDEGRLYFETRQPKAVIMRGDRPDIQMSALSTPTVAMVCTQGLEPIEYVKYEAQEEGAAVMVVPTGTVATMEALNTLQEKTTFNHPAKLRRFTELLERHADVDGLVAALGVA